MVDWRQMEKYDHKDIGQERGRLSAGVVVKRPVTRELLEADTDPDPEGAERLVEIVRRLRARSLPVGKA